MMHHQHGFRNFKGGAWDLRKVDRRKEQVTIAFPDRRVVDRRLVEAQEDELATTANLMWIRPSERDE